MRLTGPYYRITVDHGTIYVPAAYIPALRSVVGKLSECAAYRAAERHPRGRSHRGQRQGRHVPQLGRRLARGPPPHHGPPDPAALAIGPGIRELNVALTSGIARTTES